MQATFYVIKHGRQNLLGRETAIKMGVLRIGLPSALIGNVEQNQCRTAKFPTIKGVEIHIETDPTVVPVALRARPVLMRLKQKVEEELNKMLQAGIIERVTKPSAWVSPLIAVPKGNDGGVRICSDMRHVNLAVKRKFHPMPTIDDFLSNFHGAKFFSILDIKKAYWLKTRVI